MILFFGLTPIRLYPTMIRCEGLIFNRMPCVATFPTQPIFFTIRGASDERNLFCPAFGLLHAATL